MMLGVVVLDNLPFLLFCLCSNQLRRLEVHFPELPPSVDATQQRVEKWRKDFRYKNDVGTLPCKLFSQLEMSSATCSKSTAK